MSIIAKVVRDQRSYFNNNHTYSTQFRVNHLKTLKKIIKEHEEEIIDALHKDLNKSEQEAYVTEVGIIYDEINSFLKKLPKWNKDRRVRTPLIHMPGKSYIVSEPYGVTLIMSPWNYPFQLTMSPLIGAIAGGNTAVVKPSNYSPHTSDVIEKIIKMTFDEEYIAVVTGGRDENQSLLEQRFDYIFFTGSVYVGKIVMEAASKHLTPVTLELGGKSPAIVTETASIALAAKRIAFGKCINAGQTCVAPDYLLIEESVKDQFITEFKKVVEQFYGSDVINNKTYPKIINEKHFKRLVTYFNDHKFIYGGNYNEHTLKIAPTLIDDVKLDSKIMGEEIFGPILPIITYQNLNEAIQIIKNNEKPLALYLFTEDKQTEKLVTTHIAYGGGCINDTILHVAHKYLPFGGVGHSGMGSYHGKSTFDTFTHKKSIFKKSKWFDLDLRYPPFTVTKLNWIKKIFK